MFDDAEAYDRFMGRWSRLLSGPLIAFAEIRAGDAVLDVGCGTGSLALTLLETVGPSRIVGIDPSASYVAHATRRTSDPRARFEVGDAQRLQLPDATFDRTVSALVMSFLPDPARALREMIRVTRPGGSVIAAVWDYGEGMQMLRSFWDEATALDPTSVTRDEAHLPLCAPGQLPTLWRQHGLEDVVDAALTVSLRFASFDDYWAPFLLGQGPAGAHVAAHAADTAALAERLRQRLLGEGPDRPIELSARAWAVSGTVPR